MTPNGWRIIEAKAAILGMTATYERQAKGQTAMIRITETATGKPLAALLGPLAAESWLAGYATALQTLIHPVLQTDRRKPDPAPPQRPPHLRGPA